jgi:hypothetical protein
MAIFTRQKRQPRTYWAELGFMVLGLLGLQPSLFLSLFQSAPAKVASYAEQNGYNVSAQSLEGYRDWATSQINGLLPHPSTSSYNNSNGWAPAPVNVNGTMPSTSYTPGAYLASNTTAQPYAQPHAYSTQPYAQQQYTQPAFTQPAYGQPAYGQQAPANYNYNYNQPAYAQPLQSNGQYSNGQQYSSNQYSNNQYPAASYTPTPYTPAQYTAAPYSTGQYQTAQHPAVYNQQAYQNKAPQSNQGYNVTGGFNSQGYGAPTYNQQPTYGGATLNANAPTYATPNVNSFGSTWNRASPLSTGYGANTNSNGPSLFGSPSGFAGYNSPSYAPTGYSAAQNNYGSSNLGTWQRYQPPGGSPLYR